MTRRAIWIALGAELAVWAALSGCALFREPAPPTPQKRWCKRIAGPEAMSDLHALWVRHESASLVVMRDTIFECPCDQRKPAGTVEPPDGGAEPATVTTSAEGKKALPGGEGRRLSGGDEQIGCWSDESCRGYKVSGLSTARFYDGTQLVDALDRCIQ